MDRVPNSRSRPPRRPFLWWAYLLTLAPILAVGLWPFYVTLFGSAPARLFSYDWQLGVSMLIIMGWSITLPSMAVGAVGLIVWLVVLFRDLAGRP